MFQFRDERVRRRASRRHDRRTILGRQRGFLGARTRVSAVHSMMIGTRITVRARYQNGYQGKHGPITVVAANGIRVRRRNVTTIWQLPAPRV